MLILDFALLRDQSSSLLGGSLALHEQQKMLLLSMKVDTSKDRDFTPIILIDRRTDLVKPPSIHLASEGAVLRTLEVLGKNVHHELLRLPNFKRCARGGPRNDIRVLRRR